MSENKSRQLRTAQRQARALANLSGCKLNQAQMTLAIDVFGYVSWAKLKTAIENEELPESFAHLLDRDHSDIGALVSVIKANWQAWSNNFAQITYLEGIETLQIMSVILNLDELELSKIVGIN